MHECAGCATKKEVDVTAGGSAVAVFGASVGGFEVDVAFVNETGAVVGAVVVYHLRPLSRPLAEALTSANVAWCEVSCFDVLDAFLDDARAGPPVIPVLACAWSGKMCRSCHETASRAASRARHAAYASMKAERHARDVETQRQLLAAGNDAYELAREMLLLNGVLGVVETAEHDPHVLPVGKYAGMALADVWDIDKPYVLWVSGFTGEVCAAGRNFVYAHDVQVGDARRTLAKQLVAGRCIRCFEQLAADRSCCWTSTCDACWAAVPKT
jgi:hypothetical protein